MPVRSPSELVAYSSSFCALAWSHLGTTVHGVWTRCCFDASTPWVDYSGDAPDRTQLAPDCIGCAPESPFAVANPHRVFGIKAAFQSEAMNATRLRMLAGEPVDACAYCYEQEEAGVESQRQIENRRALCDGTVIQRVAATAADGSVSWFPSHLDLRLGNLCNLKCTMCDYPTSSRWGAAAGISSAALVVDPFRDDPAFWAELRRHAPELRRIYFAGGEPLLAPGHFRLLELLVEEGAAPNIGLEYNTNLTVLPPGLFERLAPFALVQMRASCDGVGRTFESIRVGASWDRFVANVRIAKQHVDVILDVAVQRDNIGDLAAIVDFAVSEAVEARFENFVAWPRRLSVRSLPPDERRARARELTELAESCRQRGLDAVALRLQMLVSYLGAPSPT